MSEQQGTSRRSVLLAGLALVLAVAAFAAAYYFLDGQQLVSDVLAGRNPFAAGVVVPETTQAAASTPTLPEGMPEEFALRLWQEQVDSQYMIGRLVSGELERLDITKVSSSSADASLSVTAHMTDGTSLDGIIGLRRFGEDWYVAFASARQDGVVVRPSGPLPTMAEVDEQLLMTMLAEQGGESQTVFDEYLSGSVTSIDIDKVKPGPSTVTIDATMNEQHGKGLARIIAIEKDISGKPTFFLARFAKTGNEAAAQ